VRLEVASAGNLHGRARMGLLTRRTWLELAVVLGTSIWLAPVDASAIAREANGYYLTGTGVRQKEVALFTVDVYVISHYMHDLPRTRSKSAVITADVDKMFALRMLRELSAAQIQGALRDSFAANGYDNRAKIDAFVAAVGQPLRKGATITIRYDAASKITTASAKGNRPIAIPGIDFMMATWSIWLGRIDQDGLGDALIERIP
jgi:Chalcone isomerase-like